MIEAQPIVRRDNPPSRRFGRRARSAPNHSISTDRVSAMRFLMLLIVWGALNGVANAEPNWWSGRKSDVPQLAGQTGKAVILYFQTPKAKDCIRMGEETWPKIDADDVDKDFIWMQLDPKNEKSFFDWWEVRMVPAVIVLDHKMGELFRIQGFVDANSLMARLGSVERASPEIVTSRNGRIIAVGGSAQAMAHREELSEAGFFFYESFDDYATLGAIRSPLFAFLDQAESRIEPTGGVLKSPCLVIDSGRRRSALVRIDVSSGLDRVQQIEGRMRVTVMMRAMKVGAEITNVGALVVVGRNESPGSPNARRYFLTLADRHEQWGERVVTTEPFNFRQSKVYLTFNVSWGGLSFGVDDIRVELLSPNASMDSADIAGGSRQVILPPRTEPLLFRRFDPDGNGRILRADVPEQFGLLFEEMDVNRDGVVTLKEGEEFFDRQAQRARGGR